MLRPRAARWFEVLCPRSDSARVVGILARTGAAQIEVRSSDTGELRLHELNDGLADYRTMLPRYQRYWSRNRLSDSGGGIRPLALLTRALERIGRWRIAADLLIERLQEAEEEHTRLQVCRRVMQGLQGSVLDFTLLNGAGPFLGRVAAVMPADAGLPAPDGITLRLELPLDGERFLLALGPATDIDTLRGQIEAARGRIVQPPPWLRGEPEQTLGQVEARLAGLETQITRFYRQLDRLTETNGLAEALGDISNLEWFVARVGVLELASKRFAWITGWTSERNGEALKLALGREDAAALIHFPPPPAGFEPPQLLDNPPWVRPFEIFARALGVPGGNEADPSPLLALLVPLLFGYMFGDLGQGLVLLAAGWLLRRRFELARLLMAGGLSAALFGLVFGSLFCFEHLIPPLWLHPLDAPLRVLALPLGFAVLLLGLGQLLHGLQAAWRGELREWLWSDAGILLAYLAAAGSLLLPQLLWVALAGLGWYLLGSAVIGGPLHALAAAGELLERGLQLLVNTLSFARVGAFALAHAGLAAAVLALADAAGSGLGAALILLLGNLLILLLEGLVVSIQTTRLILFEFFNRFLRGEGRVFRPLAPPPTIIRGEFR